MRSTSEHRRALKNLSGIIKVKFSIISFKMSLKNNQKLQKLRKIALKDGKQNSGCIHFWSKTGRILTNFSWQILTKISEISTHYEQIETDGVQSYGTMYQDISSHSDVGNLMPVTSVYSVSDGIQTNEPYQEPFNFDAFEPNSGHF